MSGEAKVTELRQQLQDCQVQAGRMLKQAKEEADKTHLEEMTRLELRHDQVCSLFILQPVVFMILTIPFYLPRSGKVKQNCGSKKKIKKKESYGFLVIETSVYCVFWCVSTLF